MHTGACFLSEKLHTPTKYQMLMSTRLSVQKKLQCYRLALEHIVTTSGNPDLIDNSFIPAYTLRYKVIDQCFLFFRHQYLHEVVL